MRSKYIPLAAVAFVLACADGPTAPLMQPGDASFGLVGSYPPPPWAEITGDITTDGSGSVSIAPLLSSAGTGGASATHLTTSPPTGYYTGMFLVNRPGTVAWLRFTDGINVTFSSNARIMSTNGEVSGVGTMTVAGHTYQLSSVDTWAFSTNCTNPTSPTTDGPPSCGSFSGDGFSSAESEFTGRTASSGGWNFDGPPGGGGGGGGDACIDPFCFDGPPGGGGGGGGEFCLSLLCTDTPGLIRGKKP